VPDVQLTRSGGLATITISVPPANRFTLGTVTQFDEILGQIDTADDLRAVLLRTEGPNFCEGAQTDEWIDWSYRRRFDYFGTVLRVFNRFEALPVPVVAAVQGLAASLGVELALRADLVVAGQSARFEHAEASVGIATMLGGVYRMAERAGRGKAIEWALTAEQTPADELARHGVVNQVVADDALQETAHKLAAGLARGATRAYAAHKQLLQVWAAGGVAAADAATPGITLPLFDTEDARAGVKGAASARRTGQRRRDFDFQGR
jgi:enoyl-CoA hydratase/carnithine racemase